MRIASVRAEPLRVPLREPFVIASGRMDETRAALVSVTLDDGDDGVVGLGEAAPLPPVTREDLPDVLAAIAEAKLEGLLVDALGDLSAALDVRLAGRPVTRAAVECAVLDALARTRGVPLRALLSERGDGPGTPVDTLHTDITIPILSPVRMGELAQAHRAMGFRCFKVKVGKDLAADRDALAAIHANAPDASLRLDANEGLSAGEALSLLETASRIGVAVECFEQPCKAQDLDGMAFVTARSSVSVIADESVRTLADLERIVEHRAGHGVNLKLAKHGGLLRSLTIGRRAKALGLRLMCGAMVETRLGLCAMAHLASALGGIDFVDLDTAFLLAHDPFEGGWSTQGPEIRLLPDSGHGVRVPQGR